jgi:hypothetical protein
MATAIGSNVASLIGRPSGVIGFCAAADEQGKRVAGIIKAVGAEISGIVPL